MSVTLHSEQPLEKMDQWDDFIEGRYREGKSEAEFRVYDASATPGVAEFYRLNHEGQTVEYVLEKEKLYFGLNKGMKTIWEAAEFLNTLVDDSDPDTDLTQIEHLLQTSEAMRRDNQPRWMVLTGFLHDLGKCLCLYGEPQWGVVGDTFPVGCAWSNEANCGLENVHMSFGHDGYIAEVMKPYMPVEALYMLRFHSFYPWHRHGAYEHLTNAQDRAMMEWVLKFNQYDLYSKGNAKPDLKQLKPYYDELFREFLPEKVAW
jgi:inositol oxygenase